jgi:hypothetical protein
MCSFGMLADKSASVRTTKVPVSATAKFHPVMPASALRIRGRVASRCALAK